MTGPQITQITQITPIQERPGRLGVALEALGLSFAVRTGLGLLPYTSLERILDRYARWFRVRRGDAAEPADLVAWAVEAAARRLPGATTCLARALVARTLLQRRGVAAELRIGVRPSGDSRPGPLAGHAWVEAQGRVVVGELEDLPQYRPLVAKESREPGDCALGVAALLRGEPVSWPDLATDPETFLAWCEDGDLTGLVHRALIATSRSVPPSLRRSVDPPIRRSADAGFDWPAEVRERLAQRARHEAGIELVRGHETGRVLAALARAGVRPVILKGTALAYTVYPQPALRPRCDTDLLIRRADVDAARRVMAELEYLAPAYCDGELLFRQFELQRQDKFGIDHAFDFHWRISTQTLFAELFAEGALEATAVPVPGLGPSARGVGPVEALLLACLHPVMHHRNEERLIWVYDTHLLASVLTPPDWDRFVDLAVDKRVTAICARGLALAQARLGSPVPAGVVSTLSAAARRAEPSAAYLDARRGWRHELADNLKAVARWRDRWRLIREIALPSPRYMGDAYRVELRGAAVLLLPLLYGHRGVRGAWRVVRGKK